MRSGGRKGDRITTMLTASLNGRRGEPGYPRVNVIYDPEQGKRRVTITAGPALMCELIQMVNALLESGR